MTPNQIPFGRRALLSTGYVLALGVGLSVAVPWNEGLRAATATAVRFNIEPVAGAAVSSDGLSDGVSVSGPWQYADYRISAGALPEPICVDTSVNTYMVLNRKMDDAGTRCSTLGGVGRQFIINVSDATACEELRLYDSDYVMAANWVLNGLEDFWPGSGACRLRGADSARIRVSNLWSRNPTTTPVAFVISSVDPPTGHGGFEIRSDLAATVTGTSTVRFVTYTGTARLYKFAPKAKPVGASFLIPLQMTFEKVVY